METIKTHCNRRGPKFDKGNSTYIRYIESTGTFNIPIPEEVDEEEELETPVAEEEAVELDDAARHESLDYLLSIMTNRDENKLNREDLIGYRNLMMEY